jgi:hypothetical protein
VRRRAYRNLVVLADSAAERIRAAGRPVPPREDLLTALEPAARAVTRAARNAGKAARLHASAEDAAQEAARTAVAAVDAVARAYVAATPALPRWRELDPREFRAELVALPRPAEGETAAQAVTG